MKGIIGIDRFWLYESWWRAPSRGQNNSRCHPYAAFSLYSHFPIELSEKWVISTSQMSHMPTSWLGLNASYSDWSLYPASWNLQISSTSWLHVLARDILIGFLSRHEHSSSFKVCSMYPHLCRAHVQGGIIFILRNCQYRPSFLGWKILICTLYIIASAMPVHSLPI